MSKILVTGGAGFIGSHLCKKLVENNHHVICLDNFFTGRKENIQELQGRDNFELVDHDVVEPYFGDKIDQIYNLACPASPIHYQHDPIKTTKTSVMGAINMLGLAKKYDARIFQASTSEIYGDPKVHPQPEEYWGNVNTIGPRACYDEGKRCAETLFVDYKIQHDLDIKILRIFNTYGPNMLLDDGRVISNFIVQALKGEDITIYGEGNQTRSFCYIDDMVDGMIKFMESPKKCWGPMNMGNSDEFSIKELAQKVIELTQSNSKIIYKDLPQDDPMQRQPDLSLAKKELNWEPSTKLNDGLEKTIAYFKEQI